MKKIVEAAKQAGLAGDRRWAISTGSWGEYILYYPVANHAYFDDPEQFMRSFQGTPGEALLQEGMAQFMATGIKTASRELIRGVPAWSYAPEGSEGDGNPMGKVHTFWLKPGANEKIDAVAKDFMAFFKEVGYSYSVYGSRTEFGDVSRVQFVEWFDSHENYYGVNSLQKLIEAKGKSEAWETLLGRLGELVTRSENSDIEWRADLSYWPETT